MNTETILYIAIAWVFLVDLIFRITEIKLINKRLLLMEENSLIESETSDAFSVRLEELEKWMQSKQPPTEQPEVMDEPRTFVNVYKDIYGKYRMSSEYPTYDEAFNSKVYLDYLETVEIIRHKKA